MVNHSISLAIWGSTSSSDLRQTEERMFGWVTGFVWCLTSRKHGEHCRWKWIPPGQSSKLSTMVVPNVTTSGQGDSLAKCFGKVAEQQKENTGILERTGMQNLGWGKRMPRRPHVFLN